MLHLPGGHVLVCLTTIPLILREVHSSQHILYLRFYLCDVNVCQVGFYNGTKRGVLENKGEVFVWFSSPWLYVKKSKKC